MTDELEARVLRTVDDAETLLLLCQLIELPSPNPPGDEAPVVRALWEHLTSAGIRPILDSVASARPNLTATIGPSGGPTLLLNGHTDTMPPGEGWSVSPYKATRRHGRVYGLGAADMKAGLAAMVAAMTAVLRCGAPLRGQVILDAVVDEEGNGAGTKRVLNRGRRADWGLIAEPTSLQLARTGNGQVNFTVNFYGTAGHGSMPEQGHNAIYDAAAFVRDIEAAALAIRTQVHPLIGPASYSVGTVSGGVRTSIIPSRCAVGVDRRLVPGETVAEAVEELRTVLERVMTRRPGAHADVGLDVEYEPFEVSEELALCQVLAQAVQDVRHRPSSFIGLRGTTDAVFLGTAGVPTIVFGPGSIEQTHQPDEYVEEHQVYDAARALALTIVRLLC